MLLLFEREFAAPAATLWAYLCEPERMNQWSSAKVRLRSAGQSAHPGGPGAFRHVHVKTLGRSFLLKEVIRDAVPGAYLRYQVVEALGLKSHTGQIFLRDQASGCHMRWQVEFEFSSSAADALVARMLRKELGASLDTLRKILTKPGQSVPLPSWAPVADPSPEDWQAADQVLLEQRTLAAQLSDRNDPKNIFAHVYSYVSEDMIAGCRTGAFVYPAWALKLLPSFHGYYMRNYQRWCGLQDGPVEAHWQRAFRVTEQGSSRYPGPEGQLASGLILSVHAHIASDLPRSLAEVYADSFATSSDYARFRGDYYSMGKIFQNATKKIRTHVPPEFVPLWARLAQGLASEDVMQKIIYKRGYDVLKRRRAAFRSGAELAELLVRRAAKREQD